MTVLDAAKRLHAVLPPTPAVWCEAHDAWLKLECLQATGAFKVRGAFNAIALHHDRPVIAASAGNHARGVAWAARHFGIQATVVVPETAPRTKVEGCRALGARVVMHGESFDEALEEARRLGAHHGWRFVHAFDDLDVIEGQGTTGVELRELEPDVVVVPVGGGGLAAGVALATDCRVVGVLVEGMKAGTIADGLRVRRQGELAMQILREREVAFVTVTEEDVRREVARLAACDHVIAEGAGAAASAALAKVGGRRRVAIVSGGNIDAVRLGEVWCGLAAASR
jgi:threonine dehydratase